jgi:hypothetical protein
VRATETDIHFWSASTVLQQKVPIDSGIWCDLVWNFKKYFGRKAGSPDSLKEVAADSGRRWSCGQHARPNPASPSVRH